MLVCADIAPLEPVIVMVWAPEIGAVYTVNIVPICFVVGE